MDAESSKIWKRHEYIFPGTYTKSPTVNFSRGELNTWYDCRM